MEKAWSLALMEYSPNGRGIMAPIKYNPMVYSHNGKGYKRFLFEVIMVMVKDKRKNHKKMQCK